MLKLFTIAWMVGYLILWPAASGFSVSTKPLETPIATAWLAEREAALAAILTDYEAARAQAQAIPGLGQGWQTVFLAGSFNGPDYNPSGKPCYWVVDGPPVLIAYDDRGPVYSQPGRWVEFNEEAFAAHYRAIGGAPLQRLAAVYDPSGRTNAAALFAAHPELWKIAIADHELNSGPAPAGFAMADAEQLGLIDLYLANPHIAALVDAYGGSPAPATGPIALEQVRLFGQNRYEQMTRFSNAMAAVRAQYMTAVDQAWQRGENVDGFTDWYLAQGGLQHQAFGELYGSTHTQYQSIVVNESGSEIFAPDVTFGNPNWSLYWILPEKWVFQHRELYTIDPNNPPRLLDNRLVVFDFEAGWATPHANRYEKPDWVETLVKVGLMVMVGHVSVGWGNTVANAVADAGYGAAAQAAASAAVVGASTSVVSGVINDNLSFKGVLQGALLAALTEGVMSSDLGKAVRTAKGGTIALRVTVKGGIQALLGGSFEEAVRAALASELAGLLGTELTKNIDSAAMSPSEKNTARIFARLLTSAVHAAGNPDDPAYAFASSFLSETLQSAMLLAETQTAAQDDLFRAEIDRDILFEAVIDRDVFEEVMLGFGAAAGFMVPDDGQATLLSWYLLGQSPDQAWALLGEIGRFVVPVGVANAPGSVAQTKMYTFDDGSKLFDLGNGKFAAIPILDNITLDDTILSEALATGRMSMGLLGVNGSRGGLRTANELAADQARMGELFGREVSVMLDNSNNAYQDGFYSTPNPQQVETLTALLSFCRDANIIPDLVVHSNAVNALALSLLQLNLKPNVPDVRLGQVLLISPNVPPEGAYNRATNDLLRIVNASAYTALVTTFYDKILTMSLAGDPTQTLIPAAVAAGVDYIRVLYGTEHTLDGMLATIDQQDPALPLLDLKSDWGALEPVDPTAWANLGFTWINGRPVYNPYAPPPGTGSTGTSNPGTPSQQEP